MAKRGRYIYEWPRPMVTVDVAAFSISGNSAKILLIRRGNEPFKGKWSLPGGFVELDEELETAALRELKEETGIANVSLEQMHTFGTIGRDPRGRQITIVYFGIISPGERIKAGDDASEARWFDIEKLPIDMGFDHDEIIRMAIRKLKRKKIFLRVQKS
ncbi:MAG: NUDIX domain-containing protein [Planctomycetota bacterium]|jgi:8-oxo-dGTP diphosphatase